MTEPGYPPPGDLYGGAPPPPPMPPGGAAVPPLPWEDRERRGFFPALFETVKLFVTSPTEAFARAKESGDYLSPILFSVLIGWVATAIGQLYGLLFQGAWLSMLPPEMRDQLGPMMATGGASFILTLILAPVLLLVWFFIWSGIVHLFLMMLGGHKQSSSGFEGTFRAVSYGYVSSLAQLIPFVGGLIAFVVLRGGDDDSGALAGGQPEATATPTPTATANANDIVLRGTNGSKAAGLMRLIKRDNGNVQFAIAAENVPANKNREVYAVWFTREGGTPRRLGFTQAPVREDGILTTGGPQQGDEDKFPQWFATYDKILITRETNAQARRPGPAVLEGTLPAGAG